MDTMIRISGDVAEVLEPQGWRPLSSMEWIDLPGGNFLQINGEGWWSGAVQGFAVGVLASLLSLGLVAAFVAAGMQ